MKLSKSTLAILKNLANINSNLSLKAGSKIVTISAGKNIMVEAIIEESFPQEFGIYDLNEFLGVLSLFESPDLQFNDKYVEISEGKNNVKYYAASQSVLTPVPNIKQFPDADIEFTLQSTMLSQIQRVASVLHASDFSIVGDGSTITVEVGDKSNVTGNCFQSEIGTTDKIFRVNLKAENLKMIGDSYQVEVGGKKICRFQSTDRQMTYYIAVELDSTFSF